MTSPAAAPPPSSRVLPLEGVVNFRDFGGYTTTGGGQVAWGRLYRSAHFHEATPADAARLDSLGVRFVLDLRRPEERAGEPNRWPGPGARTIASDDGQEALPPHTAILTQTDLTADQVERYMTAIYATYPFEARYKSLFAAYFAALAAEPAGATVVHCAAGKDRTGMVCALTLAALGVPRETILADYLLTNEAVDVAGRLPALQARLEERLGRPVRGEALLPMLGVREAYLAASFAAIEAERGTVERYLREDLAVDPIALRRRLVDGG